MPAFRTIFLALILVEFFFACNPQPGASSLLTQAEKYADSEQADSALLLIDSIFYPEKSFDKEEYMQYLVTRVRVRYKGYRDIRGDTAIFQAYKFYSANPSQSRWAALAAFYSGCVYLEQGNTNKAMRTYMEAVSHAKSTNDDQLKGLVHNNIGDLLSRQGLDRQALDAYEKASYYFLNFPQQRVVAICNVGRSYLMMGKVDSAIAVFREGLALGNQDRKAKTMLASNLSIAYSEQKNYAKALPYLRQAFINNADSSLVPPFFLNFAELYSRLGMKDSAEYYYRLVEAKVDATHDRSLQISIYNSLVDKEEQQGHDKKAIANLKKEIQAYDNLLQDRNNSSVFDIQQKYNFELLKNAHQEDVSRYQYGLILLLLILIVVVLLFSRYNIAQKNLQIETHEKIAVMSKMAAELGNSSATKMALQEQTMRALLLWKFDVIKKSVLLTKIHSDNAPASLLAKKFHQIVYQNKEEDLWADFEEVINGITKNLSNRLRASFPDLSEKEYRICLLTYAGMNVNEIAVILEVSSNSVQTYRTSLRKKLGIDNTKTDTQTYLQNIFEESPVAG